MWRKITFRTGLWIFSIVCVLALIPIAVSEYYQTGQFPYETAAAIFSSALVPNLIRLFVKTGRRPNRDIIPFPSHKRSAWGRYPASERRGCGI